MNARAVLACLVVLLPVSAWHAASERRHQAEGDNFQVRHEWPEHPPGMIPGFISGVDVDSHGHVFSFQTYTEWKVPFRQQLELRPAIQVWNSETGDLLDSWGEDFFRMPHGLSIDSSDHVWVTGRSP